MSATDAGDPRNVGVACGNCGCEKRRPTESRCVNCGRYARDPVYGYSEVTDTWYRVSEWEHVDGEHIRAIRKEHVDREDVPQEWVDHITENGDV